LPAIDEQHRGHFSNGTKVVRRGDAGNTGTDDRYFNVLISLGVN
jgi:hypothetical protein